MPERYPDLHFALIEFNAHWLASLVGSMDKCWVTGIGQDPDWWLGVWDDSRPAAEQQTGMAQLFRLNEKWPYPLMPSEYVRRQFHVSFQDDPVAVACRHITGLSTIVWGNDYPHAEGTFRGSKELMTRLFAGVPDDERAAMVGGTLGGLLGYTAPAGRGIVPELAATAPERRRPGRGAHVQLRGTRRGGDGCGTRHRPRPTRSCWPTGGPASSSTTSAAPWTGVGADAGVASAVAAEIVAGRRSGGRPTAATWPRPRVQTR